MLYKAVSILKNLLAIPVSKEHKNEFDIEINKINIVRGKITAKLFIIVELLQLFTLFAVKKGELLEEPNIYYGAMYLFLIFAMMVFYKIFNTFGRDVRRYLNNINIAGIFFADIILIWCGGISLLDLQSGGLFIVYAVAILCVGVTPFYKPITLMFIYTISHIPFLILIPYFQVSPKVIYSIYINSTAFVIIAWAISYMRYKQIIQDLSYKKIIEIQYNDLMDSNKKLEEANKQLEQFNQIDYLTGINNRYVFDKIIKMEWDRCKRNFTSLSLIMIDIDYFKAFNDHYGHQAGDECLKQIAQVLKSSAGRASDTIARYGGEEFAVILPYLRKEGAEKLAQKIKNNVEQLNIPHSYSSISDHITISLGVYTVVPSNELTEKEFIRIADTALYKAKEDRNKVVVA